MKYRVIFLDLDGVLWRGEEPIEKNLERVREWEREGRKLVYITNNSTRLRKYYLEKLRKLGLFPELPDIITSAFATAVYLKEKGISSVYVVGEEGLKGEIKGLGMDVFEDEGSIIEGEVIPDAVAVGMDRDFTYRKIWAAFKAVRGGAHFVASNRDRVYPLPKGEAPGGGVMVRAIEEAIGRKADITIGKPERPIMELALRVSNEKKENILMVGDRLDTDIEAAKRAGIDSLLVLTGLTESAQVGQGPTYIVEDLSLFREDQ